MHLSSPLYVLCTPTYYPDHCHASYSHHCCTILNCLYGLLLPTVFWKTMAHRTESLNCTPPHSDFSTTTQSNPSSASRSGSHTFPVRREIHDRRQNFLIWWKLPLLPLLKSCYVEKSLEKQKDSVKHFSSTLKELSVSRCLLLFLCRPVL